MHFKIINDWYGLPQEGKLANDPLQNQLAGEGRNKRKTPRLLKHALRPVQFVLVKDKFAIEYVGKQHTPEFRKHLEEIPNNLWRLES